MPTIISPLETLEESIARNIRFVVRATEIIGKKIREFDEETIRTQNRMRQSGREWVRPEGETSRFILMFLRAEGITEIEYLACLYGGASGVEVCYRSRTCNATETTKGPS